MLVGGFAHTAEAGSCALTDWNFGDCVNRIFAEVINKLLEIAAWLLAFGGYLLNISMKLTLNIKTFVDNTPAIYEVWRSIRDISGMFIIFVLLYAAIKMILTPVGVPGTSAGSLIKTVVMAGILINFSFFITGLGIDASNVISAQLYKTIAPASDLNGSDAIQLDSWRSNFDGGISDIFMSSLKVTTLYQNGLSADYGGEQGGATTFSKIILSGVIGIIIMVTSAASFFLVSLAFIARFVILIFLLGFSPIWFASFVIPDLKKYATDWASTYKSQLIFMPAYLLLLYFALKVLNGSNIFRAGSATANWQENLLVFGINAVFVIIMLNVPLLAAISIGAKMPKWAEKAGAGAIWSRFGQQTIGRAASRVNEGGLARWAYSKAPNAGLLVSKGLSSISSSGFGMKKGSYDDSAKASVKGLKDLEKRIGTVNRENYSSATAFHEAERSAKGMKANFNHNLTKRSPFTMFMKNKQNMAHAYATQKKNRDDKFSKELNEQKAAAEAEISDNNIQIGFIEKELARGITEGGTRLSPEAKIGLERRKKSLQTINEQQRKALQSINEELGKIKAGVTLDDLAEKMGRLDDKISSKE